MNTTLLIILYNEALIILHYQYFSFMLTHEEFTPVMQYFHTDISALLPQAVETSGKKCYFLLLKSISGHM